MSCIQTYEAHCSGDDDSVVAVHWQNSWVLHIKLQHILINKQRTLILGHPVVNNKYL